MPTLKELYRQKGYKPFSKQITEAKRMADNYVKTHTDEYGQVSDPQVYLTAISFLSPYADDLSVANKIADLQNNSLKIQNKIEEAENNTVVFDNALQKSITDVFQQNYKDPRGLFFKLLETYGTALDEFDEKLLGDALMKLPKGQKIPKTVLDARDELSKKVNNLTNLSNSYLLEDPETKLSGPLNPDAYGIFIRTNPQTGAIVIFEKVDEVQSLEKAPTGYTKTDARYGRIPIYLNTFSEDKKIKGNLGGIIFEADKEEITIGDATTNINVLKRKDGIGLTGWLERQYRRMGEETGKGILQEQQEIGGPLTPEARKKFEKKTLKERVQEFPMLAVPFDYYAIPVESVVKDFKNNYYFYDKNEKLWKAKDVDTLKNYLKEIGKNPEDVDNRFFYGHPDFINSKSLFNDDGTKRTIDENTLGGVIRPSVAPSAPTTQEGWRQQAAPSTITPSARAPRITPPVKEPPEFFGEEYDVRKLIKKGKEFFKPLESLWKI